MNKKGFIQFTGGVIIALALAIPLLIGGAAITYKLITFLNTPIINGQVPMWVILLTLLTAMILLRRRGQTVRIVDR